MTNLDCALCFADLSGRISVAERGQQNDRGFWDSNEFVSRDIENDIDLTVACEQDEIRIVLSAAHIENKETNRAFHSHINCNLEWNEVKQLRDFLSLILTWQLEKRSPDD
jgi:hypothetical protein